MPRAAGKRARCSLQLRLLRRRLGEPIIAALLLSCSLPCATRLHRQRIDVGPQRHHGRAAPNLGHNAGAGHGGAVTDGQLTKRPPERRASEWQRLCVGKGAEPTQRVPLTNQARACLISWLVSSSWKLSSGLACSCLQVCGYQRTQAYEGRRQQQPCARLQRSTQQQQRRMRHERRQHSGSLPPQAGCIASLTA